MLPEFYCHLLSMANNNLSYPIRDRCYGFWQVFKLDRQKCVGIDPRLRDSNLKHIFDFWKVRKAHELPAPLIARAKYST